VLFHALLVNPLLKVHCTVRPSLTRTNKVLYILGPKPLKRFTPPPDYKESEESQESEEESEEESENEEEEEDAQLNPNLVRASDKQEDEYLKQAASAARAKVLRDKFEKWEQKELAREEQESLQNRVNGSAAPAQNQESSENVEITSIECTKDLRARLVM